MNRPERIRRIVGKLEEVSRALLEEGFAWAPAELDRVADELRDHITVIAPREGVQA
jgi:hypothetical protein